MRYDIFMFIEQPLYLYCDTVLVVYFSKNLLIMSMVETI